MMSTRRRKHICHAEGCETPCPPRLLMCARHWRMVPKELQNAVYDTYRPGQERDMRPSIYWLDAATAAENHVREIEGYHVRPLPSAILKKYIEEAING